MRKKCPNMSYAYKDRSLQKLNVPEWYKHSTVPSQAGFLLKRHSDVGHHYQPQTTVGSSQKWSANTTLPSKTTSLSSLGCNLSPAPKSPNGKMNLFIKKFLYIYNNELRQKKPFTDYTSISMLLVNWFLYFASKLN